MSLTRTRTALASDRDSLTHPTPHLIARWSSVHPCLANATCPADLIDVIQGNPSQGISPSSQTLWAMLDIASHDSDAGRVVLHAFRPLIEATIRRCTDRYPHEEILSIAVTAMWETIRTFPLHRNPTQAAANLRGDFLKRMCGKWADPDTALAEASLLPPDDLDAIAHLEDDDRRALALDLLARASEAGVLSLDETRLLLATFLDDLDDEEVAQDLKLTRAALRQRRSRALRRLAQWSSQNA